jgi:APA family basic amino acid/polyamine antiporter
MNTRSLGFWRCWGLVVGGAIGSAVFMMPAVLAPYGYMGLISLAVATVGAMSVALTIGHMARRVTVSGGCYAYARAAFGDLPGFLTAWAFWISYWVSLPAIAIGFAAYAGSFVPAIAASARLSAATALIMLWTTVAINSAGVRESGIVSLATSILKLMPIALVCLGGVWAAVPDWPPAPTVPGSPLMIFGSVFALAFWNFVGIEAASVAADNVVDPATTIPRALVAGTATVGAVYLFVVIVSLNTIAPETLALSSTPLADVGRSFLGRLGGLLISMGALVSTAGCLNVGTLGTGQIAMAAARDGLFPGIFARLTSRATPLLSYAVAGVLASALLLFSFSDSLVGAWTFVSLLATLTSVVPYSASALASLAFQRRERTILPIELAAAVAALGTCIWIVISAGVPAVAWGGVLIAAGLPVYRLMHPPLFSSTARLQP